MFLVIIGPLFIRNTFYLLLIIILNILIVTGWYLYGYCFCTDIENGLSNNEKNKEKNKENTKSFITLAIEKQFSFIDEKYIHNLISTVPFISTVMCCFSLYNKFYKCRKNK
jgi:hypothetical protein